MHIYQISGPLYIEQEISRDHIIDLFYVFKHKHKKKKITKS